MRTPVQVSASRAAWCGPYALAYVLGISYMSAARRVQQVGRRSRLPQRVYVSEMKAVLDSEGALAGFEKYGYETPTFRQWAKANAGHGKRFIVNVTGHYIVVDGNRWIDNQQRKLQPLYAYAHPRKRVRAIMEIAASHVR